jgi:putative nucleotidyltransferase with HDIG domain
MKMANEMIKHKEIISLLDKTEELFNDYVKKPELKNHCLEVSAIMRALSKEFAKEEGDDPKVKEEKWAAVGLLHDIDYEQYPDLKVHGKITAQRLKPLGYHDDMIHAILSHNEEGTGIKRENTLDYALAAADNISGLIYAYALMRHGLAGMEVSGLKKKFKDKTFAAAIRRDLVSDIEKTGISLDRFFEISIQAMQSIADKIGFK